MNLLNTAALIILTVLKLRVFLVEFGYFGEMVLKWKSFIITSNLFILKFQRIKTLNHGSQQCMRALI